LQGDSFADEQFELRPISLYAETKVAAEQEVLRRNGSLASTCLRFATVYGPSPRMRFDLTVNEFTRDLAARGELVVFGEQFWRPYVHVRDAARAIAQVLAAPASTVAGEAFNVGSSSENYRKLDIVDLCRERFPEGKIEFVHRDEDPRDYRVSFEKLRERLGFEPERSVANGIDEVLALLRSGLIDDPYDPCYRN
jgi:nucleoside-diphosphate-sugar epimerase